MDAREKISYQAVIRDANNLVISNGKIGMKISILQASAEGLEVYIEKQKLTTSENGIINIKIGGETGFNTIDWDICSYFIKTEVDPDGGVDYKIIKTHQLLVKPSLIKEKLIVQPEPLKKVIVAPEKKEDVIINSDKIIEVYNPITGRTWIDRNLGASKVAENYHDRLSFGDHFAWGIWDIPVGYHIPTDLEWKEEIETWSSTHEDGVFNSILKLPLAGRFIYNQDRISDICISGLYWSRAAGMSDIHAVYISHDYIVQIIKTDLDYGYSIRCIKDE